MDVEIVMWRIRDRGWGTRLLGDWMTAVLRRRSAQRQPRVLQLLASRNLSTKKECLGIFSRAADFE
jgi:hypothetical protein